MILKIIGIIIVIVIVVFSVRLILFAYQSQNMAVADSLTEDHRMNLCSNKPNCVNSFQNREDKSYIEPLILVSSPSEAFIKLTEILTNTLQMKIIAQKNNLYIHATSQTPLFGYIDDVEFVIDENNKLVHMRSASRVGYSDLGANRKRIEKIRSLLNNSL